MRKLKPESPEYLMCIKTTFSGEDFPEHPSIEPVGSTEHTTPEWTIPKPKDVGFIG